ncbi:hypothetical protein ABIE33_003040 [Ensifer sp. 4252]
MRTGITSDGEDGAAPTAAGPSNVIPFREAAAATLGLAAGDDPLSSPAISLGTAVQAVVLKLANKRRGRRSATPRPIASASSRTWQTPCPGSCQAWRPWAKELDDVHASLSECPQWFIASTSRRARILKIEHEPSAHRFCRVETDIRPVKPIFRAEIENLRIGRVHDRRAVVKMNVQHGVREGNSGVEVAHASGKRDVRRCDHLHRHLRGIESHLLRRCGVDVVARLGNLHLG